MGSRAFSSSYEITFVVYPSEPLEGWSSNWYNSSYATILWGFTGEEITYTFESNGGSVVENIVSSMPITIPAGPTRDGFYFQGWYDNAELEGDPITGSYYNSEKTAFYAKWMTQEEFEAQFAGTSIEYAIDMNIGEQVDVVIDTNGEMVYYKFTTTEAGVYNLTLGTGDLVLYLYSASGAKIDHYYSQYDYDTWEYTEVNENVELKAGTTYYLAAKYYSSYDLGTLHLTVTAQ
jgi:uncharacterized repeat protein (TIGR02543 family)